MVVPNPITNIEQQTPPPTRTYALDFDNKRVTGMVDGKAAIEQFAKKALLTKRFAHLIYNPSYGSEIMTNVFMPVMPSKGGYNFNASAELIDTVLPNVVRDALIHDGIISDVTDFSYKVDGDAVGVNCTIVTAAGAVEINVNT